MSRIKKRNLDLPPVRATKLVHYFPYENLLILGECSIKRLREKGYKMVIGFGIMRKAIKGEKFDIIRVNFGSGVQREILVVDNHARRQIHTLKQGQYMLFVGKMRNMTYNHREGKYFIADMLQGMYVPKILDIKRSDIDMSNINDEEDETMINFLDEITKEIEK